ncbi:MAG: hypothetical protein HC797_03000 [Anaerolineales bacterium]|nr:hypothetical protein [Anaerolineales bacterium]
MENIESPENKKRTPKDYIMILFGILVFITSCALFVGSVALDVTGEQAIGDLSNAAFGDCSPGKTCWTGRMDFVAKDGQQITFYPMTPFMFFDFDPFLSGRPYETYGDYQVRYFEQYPQIAKVKLAFFLEYVNMVCGLGIGAFVLFLTYILSSFGRKPIVLDLRHLRKGNK